MKGHSDYLRHTLLAEGGTVQEAKSKQASIFEASACVISANIPLAEASPTSTGGGGQGVGYTLLTLVDPEGHCLLTGIFASCGRIAK